MCGGKSPSDPVNGLFTIAAPLGRTVDKRAARTRSIPKPVLRCLFTIHRPESVDILADSVNKTAWGAFGAVFHPFIA